MPEGFAKLSLMDWRPLPIGIGLARSIWKPYSHGAGNVRGGRASEAGEGASPNPCRIPPSRSVLPEAVHEVLEPLLAARDRPHVRVSAERPLRQRLQPGDAARCRGRAARHGSAEATLRKLLGRRRAPLQRRRRRDLPPCAAEGSALPPRSARHREEAGGGRGDRSSLIRPSCSISSTASRDTTTSKSWTRQCKVDEFLTGDDPGRHCGSKVTVPPRLTVAFQSPRSPGGRTRFQDRTRRTAGRRPLDRRGHPPG